VRVALTTVAVLALVSLVVASLGTRGADEPSVTRAVPGEESPGTPVLPTTTAAPSTAPSATAAPSADGPSTGAAGQPQPGSSASPRLVVPSPRASTSPGGLPPRLRVPTRPRLRPAEELPSLEFTLTSFNVLGASHTRGRGARPGYASGAVRIGWTAELLRRHRADVVGFQELQVGQLRRLRSLTNLDFYPGLAKGALGAENSIGWRRDEWVAVDRRTIDIPYFDGGPRAMPLVRLRSVSAPGIEAWFANFHNPAETARFHHQQRFRTQATLIQARLANLLVDTGLPVFITGDMNERAEYFCRLTSRAPMVAARGGTNIAGRCEAADPPEVDWIFGSQGVQFSDYVEDDSELVDRASDHPLIATRVRIQGATASTDD
jgi:hypothetical protein